MAKSNLQEFQKRLERHKRLEEASKLSPGKLRGKLLRYGLFALSLPVLFIVACVLLAFGGLLVAYFFHSFHPVYILAFSVIIIIAAGFGVYAALNGLTAQFVPRRDKPLNPKDFPLLFEMIEQIRKETGAPELDKVTLIDTLNAGVDEQWTSLFNRTPQYNLYIGLDMMALLSKEEFKSVLAHEMGHLVARDTYYSSWFSRVLLCWQNILEGEETGNSSLVKMFRSYWSRFQDNYNAIRLTVSRQAEFQADLAETKVTSPETAAHSLLRFDLYLRALAIDYERELYLASRKEPVPPEDFYEHRLEYLSRSLDHRVIEEALHMAGSIQTALNDSHPALKDRLAAIGYPDMTEIILPEVDEPATDLLGDKQEEVEKRIAKIHRRKWVGWWRENYEQARRDHDALKLLDEYEDSSRSPQDKEWEKLSIKLNDMDNWQSELELTAFLEKYPNHSEARLLRGTLRLLFYRENGREDVELAVAERPDLRPVAFEALGNYLYTSGQFEELLKLIERVDHHADEWEKSNKERNKLSPSVKLLPTRLKDHDLKDLKTALAELNRIETVYIARAETTYFPEEDFYVVVVGMKDKKVPNPDHLAFQVSKNLHVPHKVFVVPPSTSKWISAISGIEDSRLDVETR